jgi:hypothetical protein
MTQARTGRVSGKVALITGGAQLRIDAGGYLNVADFRP